jgi:glycosyltransferase involved in cell wall biosynthesis
VQRVHDVEPVKVLVFQNRFLIGGQERQTVLHLTTLDRRRWEPVVRCLRLEGEHLEDLARIGVRPESLDVHKMARPATLWRVARLAAQLRATGVALVHAQDFYTNTLGLLAARLAGIPSIVTRVDLAHALDPLQRKALALVSRHAARVLVNALCIRDACLRDGVQEDRIAVVRNGLDLAAFDRAAAGEPDQRGGAALFARGPLGGEPSASPSVEEGGAVRAPFDFTRPTVVQVANMHHPVKGQADLLVAMREVLGKVPEAQLFLVGDGALRPRLERMAKELGIAGCIGFAGYRRDVPAILARSTVVVSASHAEGISNAVLEAMAARRPVVGTAVGGTPELVRDGANGFLVPPGAPPVLASRIMALLRNPTQARRMGEEGRLVVEREFGVEVMKQNYDALYSELVAEADGKRARMAA